jgi:hypothetical protein
MIVPKNPPRHADNDDAGFAPLPGKDNAVEGDADDADHDPEDLEGDYHEDGGGD